MPLGSEFVRMTASKICANVKVCSLLHNSHHRVLSKGHKFSFPLFTKRNTVLCFDVCHRTTHVQQRMCWDQFSTHIRHIDRGILQVRYDKATAGSENIKRFQILTPLILVLDVDQTQTQLKIANVSDQTHIRHIDRGILPVRYDKATAGSENIKRCQILTPLIPVLDVNQTQTQLKIANVSDQTHIRHINRGILPV